MMIETGLERVDWIQDLRAGIRLMWSKIRSSGGLL
jgi:hypothetical protein